MIHHVDYSRLLVDELDTMLIESHRDGLAVAEGVAMETDHVDVLIVGAGLSGIGAACHLQKHCPHKTFAILEAREALGGTWDLFRYPGIRSDSDMFTLGYSFRPWDAARAIADGPSILQYIRDTAREHGVEERIRFGHRVLHAAWSTVEARWTVEAERIGTGETVTVTCGFLYACTGYYRYDEGYTPQFQGIESFRGSIVHPQHWDESLDCAGKRVVVIGSGSTAVTLVPSLAEHAEHVTMLQRSPSYIVALPALDPIAGALRRVLPAKIAYAILRWKNARLMMLNFKLSRRAPKLMRRLIRSGVARRLPAGYDIDTHFNPSYEPWDQRLCLAPDGDLFDAVSDGRASVTTEEIESFTESGLKLSSGEELPADIIITATGLNLLALGGLQLAIDGVEVELSRTVAYKGAMLCGVPNLAMTFGYTNASWTLKADLVATYVCRLLTYMDEHGHATCTPQPPDPSLPTEPFLDLNSGYVLRSIDLLPRQGTGAPWRLHQNYFADRPVLKRGPVDDAMHFSAPHPQPQPQSRNTTAEMETFAR
jgi:cation diffusion facilitator CzcD-associated flavoprotein CzcO